MAADIQTIELTAIDDATIELSVDGAVISTVTLDMETSMLDASAVVNIVKQYVLAMQQNVEAEIPTELSQLVNDVGFITEDGDTTYSLSVNGDVVTLTGSDGSSHSATIAPTNSYVREGSSGVRFGLEFANGDVWETAGFLIGSRLTGVTVQQSGSADRYIFGTKNNGASGTVTITPDLYQIDLYDNTRLRLYKKNVDDGTVRMVSVANLASLIPTPVTYSLSISGNVITLTGSDGSTSTIDLPVYDGGTT